MRSSAAARRYSRALFALAREEGRIVPIRDELNALAGLLGDNDELRQALFRPLHPVAERRRVLAEVTQRMGACPVVRNFFSYLIDQRRLVDFEGIFAEYGRLADEAAGRTVATVVSASPLDAAQCHRLREALAARTGREVTLEMAVDPTLLGGVIASVGTQVFDGSLRSQLNQLRTSLTKGH
jgi:F-type H+-transporting ATPase subunit delta